MPFPSSDSARTHGSQYRAVPSDVVLPGSPLAPKTPPKRGKGTNGRGPNGNGSSVLAFELEEPQRNGHEDVALLVSDSGPSAQVTHSHSHGQTHGHGHGSGEKCGVGKTLANIFISFLGAGILGLPYAFMRAGLILGTTFMLFLSVLAFYSINLLVDSKRLLEHKGVKTYSEVAAHALGNMGKTIVEVLLVLSQTGFCVAYLIFISSNLAPLLPFSSVTIVVVVLPLQIALAMLRDLSALAPFSLLADFAHVVGMVVVLKDDVDNFVAHETVVYSKGAAAVPFLFGVVIYCFEGIGMILPVEDSMKDRSRFKTTLSIGFSVITTIFLVFGVVGYSAFGETTDEIITNNLPHDWTTTSVKVALCLALFFTFPVMMVPVYEILERSLDAAPWFERNVSPNKRWAVFRLNRTLMVVVIAFISVSVPGFAFFISFIGSFCCASLAFIIPATCHLVLFSGKLSFWRTAMDYFLLIFGLTGMVFGVAESVTGALRAA